MVTPFKVPTIDISPYLSSPTSPEAQEIITAIRDACTTTGFFQITNHGISPDLQKAVFEGSKKFFELPMEEKVKLDKSKSVGASNRGYE
jgi:isopenicillin N synthase-like dioxygenase